MRTLHRRLHRRGLWLRRNEGAVEARDSDSGEYQEGLPFDFLCCFASELFLSQHLRTRTGAFIDISPPVTKCTEAAIATV